jgi:hypothetical protein
MKLLFIVCESSVDDKIMELLTRLGAPGYTRFTGGTGFGNSGLREGTAVWPGLNSMIMSAVPEHLVPAVHSGIDDLKAHRSGKLAVKVFVSPLEEY